MIDLHAFCSRDHPRLMAPVTQGDHTYATNGHVMIRVPAADGIPDRDDAPDMAGKFAECFNDGPVRPMVTGTLPPVTTDTNTCDDCDGRGHDHECPSCTCKCETCGGSGMVETSSDHRVSVSIGGASFNLSLVRVLQTLPGTCVSEAPLRKGALSFRFDGGDGVLMALRSPWAEPEGRHLDIAL